MSLVKYRLDVLKRASALEVAKSARFFFVMAVEERITLAELRIRLGRRYGCEPHPKTIYRALRRGMPREPHELIEGRWVYPWLRCIAWLEEQRKPKPLPKALVGALKGGLKKAAQKPTKKRR